MRPLLLPDGVLLLRLLLALLSTFFLTAKGKRGAKRGKQPLVFPPREMRAHQVCRTHSRSALSERRLGMIVFKDINIFRENRPSDERYLLDFIFGVFTGARIRGGTKGRRRPKHLR